MMVCRARRMIAIVAIMAPCAIIAIIAIVARTLVFIYILGVVVGWYLV
jgi:hypothetical protein